MIVQLARLGILGPVVATLALLACSEAEATPTATTVPIDTHTSAPTPTSSTAPAPGPEEVSLRVISSELSVGSNRLVFVLLDRDLKTVQEAEAEFSTSYPADPSPGEPHQVVRAQFRKWPLGDVGVYTAVLDLDRSGTWGFSVEVAGAGGLTRISNGSFQVAEESSTPAVGSPAPRSRNKTGRDVGDLAELTSAQNPDPDLYSMTIADAISTGKPLVVVFATPLFCSTVTCGPQVEVIEDVKDRYQGKVNFIHVEIFDNPHEIEGDLSRARTAPAVEEWGLVTEPWTFLVDSQGLIAAKFEAFTTQEELQGRLDLLLRE